MSTYLRVAAFHSFAVFLSKAVLGTHQLRKLLMKLLMPKHDFDERVTADNCKDDATDKDACLYLSSLYWTMEAIV